MLQIRTTIKVFRVTWASPFVEWASAEIVQMLPNCNFNVMHRENNHILYINFRAFNSLF